MTSTITDTEQPLAGGNINSAVVRIGATVRRGQTAASPAVHQLLRHLEAKGFDGSPRFLGIDADGREILSFIDGTTGIPPALWRADAPLLAAARMLRRYHDATLDFVGEGPLAWAHPYPDARRHEVICHNDFAPYNFIYGPNSIPTAVVDFDLAGPGPRLRDIAYGAYWLTPLSFQSEDMQEYAAGDLQAGSRRLKLFCATYGTQANAELLAMVEEFLTYMGDEQQVAAVVGETAAAGLKAGGHLAHWQREAAAFRQQRVRIQANL